MQITCPHCQFSKDVNEQWIPQGPSRVDCPECHKVFFFSHDGGVSRTPPKPQVPRIKCPSCGLDQPEGAHCAGCGIVYAKWKRKQQGPGEMQFELDEGGDRRGRRATSPQLRPKAGFWIRVAATLVDGLILMVLSGILLFLLVGSDFLQFFALMSQIESGAMPFDPNDMAFQQQMMLEMEAFGRKMLMAQLALMLLQFVYYVIPTGLWGQTPGKKVCGIRVVRADGRVGLGWAFLREVVGKFISGIIFGIGFLMVAFHGEKRGLHDLIAGTWVVKSR